MFTPEPNSKNPKLSYWQWQQVLLPGQSEQFMPVNIIAEVMNAITTSFPGLKF